MIEWRKPDKNDNSIVVRLGYFGRYWRFAIFKLNSNKFKLGKSYKWDWTLDFGAYTKNRYVNRVFSRLPAPGRQEFKTRNKAMKACEKAFSKLVDEMLEELTDG